ncbi:MAG: hypothetical protein ACOX12_08900 [Eggerthellaceae bacterium]
MADKQDGYKLISVDGNEEDEVVFHAGTRHEQDRPTPEEPASQPARSKATPASAASSEGEGEAEQRQQGASASSSAQGDEDRRAPKTAQERQRERERAQRRQLAEEIAATEADLDKAGKMSKPQVAIIIVCIVLLVVTVVYVVSSFIS